MTGWIIWILGVPAWVIVFIEKHNWMAASIEAGAVPSMLFGLWNVHRRLETPNRFLDRLTSLFTYGAILLGVGYSIYDHHGITVFTQYLEVGAVVGFLMGSYLLAKNSSFGWIFFILMNGSACLLMAIQNKQILAIQQAVSLCFVTYGLRSALRVKRLEGRLQ